MQTILGSGGAIATPLAQVLSEYSADVRLVSRNPRKVNDSDALVQADLTDPAQVARAVEGSDVCYVTIGFEYTTAVWQERWMPFIKSVVEACGQSNARLVFFDNIYAIGGDNVRHITENSPISPTSRKGQIRADVDRHILESVEKGKVKALIARAPDFMGPIKATSMLMNTVYDNMVKGKKAQWFCNADVIHTFGYTPQLARGTAMLGNTPDAFDQVWNLPADPEPITGRQWVRLFAEELKAPERVQVIPAWGVRALGWFVPVVGEMVEMLYQYDRDYVFDSGKFNRRFNFTPVTNREAVQQTISELRRTV